MPQGGRKPAEKYSGFVIPLRRLEVKRSQADGGHEVDRPLRGGARASQGLAVQGHGLTGIRVLGQPGSDGCVQGVAVQTGQQPAERAGPGCGPRAETVVQVGRELGGANPLELWSPSYTASPTVRLAQYSFS